MNIKRVSNEFFTDRPTAEIAKDLLGRQLAYFSPAGLISGWIVEAEAYLGENDSAAHAYKRRRTAFDEPLYHEAGTIYIYQRRQYYFFDIVTQAKETPEGVLIRAIEPAQGIDLMHNNRPVKDPYLLTNGPGKLMQALGIQDKLRNFQLVANSDLTILENKREPKEILATPRIGVNEQGSTGLARLRFIVSGNPYVSRIRKSLIDDKENGWIKSTDHQR